MRHSVSTVYGRSRASPRSFFVHHLAAVSAAIVAAESLDVRVWADGMHRALLIPDPAPTAP
eukprot:4650017-Prymnesium_polylepis.1